MNKRRGFLLATLLLLFVLTIITSLMLIPAGYRISDGIMYMFCPLVAFGIVETSFAGLSVLTIIFGTALSYFLLLVAVVFFIISAKNSKLSIPTYIISGLAMLMVLGTFITVLTIELLANSVYFGMNLYAVTSGKIIDYDNYSYKSGTYYYYYSYERYPFMMSTYPLIQNAVRGGLGVLTSFLAMGLGFIPFVTFVLSIFIGGFKRKPKAEPVVEEVKGIEEVK